jgi:PAS domain S-box-containing protein
MHICVLLSLAEDGFESADEFPDGSAIAVMVNSNAQIIYCNGNFVRMTGLSLDEVMGRNWSDVFVSLREGLLQPGDKF